MTAPNDSPLFIRFTLADKERLRIVAKARGQHMSDYAATRLLAAIAEDEAALAPIIRLQRHAQESE